MFKVSDCNFCEKDKDGSLLCILTRGYEGLGGGHSTYECFKEKCILQKILNKR